MAHQQGQGFVTLNEPNPNGRMPPHHGNAQPQRPPQMPGHIHVGPGINQAMPPLPPLPIDLRGRGIGEIQDVRHDLMSESDMRDKLSHYTAFRFEKVPESRKYDNLGQPKNSTWEQALKIPILDMSQDQFLEQVHWLDRTTHPVVEKKKSLNTFLQRQIDTARQTLANEDPDPVNYEWVLAQVDHKLEEIEPVVKSKDHKRARTRPARFGSKLDSRGHSIKKPKYKRVALTAIFRRGPRSNVNVKWLWAMSQGSQVPQNPMWPQVPVPMHGPPNMPPNGGPPNNPRGPQAPGGPPGGPKAGPNGGPNPQGPPGGKNPAAGGKVGGPPKPGGQGGNPAVPIKPNGNNKPPGGGRASPGLKHPKSQGKNHRADDSDTYSDSDDSMWSRDSRSSCMSQSSRSSGHGRGHHKGGHRPRSPRDHHGDKYGHRKPRVQIVNPVPPGHFAGPHVPPPFPPLGHPAGGRLSQEKLDEAFLAGRRAAERDDYERERARPRVIQESRPYPGVRRFGMDGDGYPRRGGLDLEEGLSRLDLHDDANMIPARRLQGHYPREHEYRPETPSVHSSFMSEDPWEMRRTSSYIQSGREAPDYRRREEMRYLDDDRYGYEDRYPLSPRGLREPVFARDRQPSYYRS